jgi:hypothetical protein
MQIRTQDTMLIFAERRIAMISTFIDLQVACLLDESELPFPKLHRTVVPLRRLGSFLPNIYSSTSANGQPKIDVCKFGQIPNIGQICLFYRVK